MTVPSNSTVSRSSRSTADRCFVYAGHFVRVDCKTQAEVDHLWDKLSAGGEQQQCAAADKYGVTWQIGAVYSG